MSCYPSGNELMEAILHGNITKGFPEPPCRLVKLFISSTRTDFEYERQHLHEVVLPKLERFCNALSLDLLAIDPHWQVQTNGIQIWSSSAEQTAPKQPAICDNYSNYIDPHEFQLQLNEIEQCAQQSLATFFMCLIGHKYRPIALPTVIASNDFQQIFTAAAESGLGDVNLLRSCYKENRNLQPEPHYVLLEPRRASRQYEQDLEHIAKLVEYGSKVAAREGMLSPRFGVVMSAVHQQTLHALYWARQSQSTMANSPTQRNLNLESNQCVKSPLKSSQTTGPVVKLNSSSEITMCGRRSNRLIHQVSLQQGPTQQKISMPRQTSVSTNYDLMQQPVDRMLCFVRQLEGVNFNNASVSRFFDVTPTTMSISTTNDQENKQTEQTNVIMDQPMDKTYQQTKQLYAPSAQNDIQQLIEDVILGLKKGNVHYFNISWSPPTCMENNLQTRTYTVPADYIERFGETVLRTLKNSIQKHYHAMQQSPFGLLSPGATMDYPGDIVREAHSHLSNFRRVMGALGMAQAINHSDFGHLLHIRQLLIADESANVTGIRIQTHQTVARHQPIIVTGCSGSGKSTLLAQVFTYAPDWLSDNSDRDQVIRIVRQCGQSPSSNFASELLRSLCIQISVAFGLESHLSRSATAHELSELAICFQELLKLGNNRASNCDLLIILDDLHHLQSALQSSALLGWMPWNLPSNVHFICSVALESESVLSILRSRIASENFVCLDEDHRMNCEKHSQSIFSMVQSKLRDEKRTLTSSQWDFVREKFRTSSNGHCECRLEMTPLFANMLAESILSNWESFYIPEYLPCSVNELVPNILDELEDCLPYQLVKRICSYLTCTKYGLRETELYNLVHETITCQIWMANANAMDGSMDYSARSTTCTWIILKSKMRHLLKQYYVQGQLYFNWRSSKVANAVKLRYLNDIRQIRQTHSELASAFYNSFNELNSTEKQCESVREADELWYHLVYSGNQCLLKSQALLNIRFLNAIIQGVSVCYLRCILDAVRSQVLDWHIEQLYAMLKQSVHVVSQEPNQLAVEALLWLVPFASPGTLCLAHLVKSDSASQTKKKTLGSIQPVNSSGHLVEFLRECYKNCLENNERPLLHPVNIWLNLPVPPQLTMITSPWASITRAVCTSHSQHLIACQDRWLHFYHLPTKTIVKSLEGHQSTITCLHLSSSGKWLATGCDDNSVNIWSVQVELMEVTECSLSHRFNHHSAGVLCVTINQAETLVLSGSENGAICAVNLHSGMLMTRLEHHKSMVTCIGINSGDDVLVSGSTDRTVVIWSLDTFCILNEILLMRPVLHMDISLDSTFLLLSLDDNTLQIRALTTGTAVHTLQPSISSSNAAVISYVRFAEDNCRCVVGYADGRLLLFDIHSARQLHSLNGHTEMITSILPQKDDHFLISTGGNKIIIWNFYPVRRVDQTMSELCTSSFLTGGQSGLDRHDLSTLVDPTSPIKQMCELALAVDSTGITDSNKDLSGSSTISTTNVTAATNCASGRSSRSSSDRRKHKTSSSSSTQSSFKKKVSVSSIENHREAITCVCMARDGQYVATGGRDCLLKVWISATGETHTTLEESSAPITAVDISPNSQFVVFGSEDGLLRTWSLSLSMYLSKFNEHLGHSILVVKTLSDNKRVLSADANCVIRLWQLDNGAQIKVIHHKPITGLHVHGATCFAIAGKIDNCLKYWQVFEPDNEKSVSHSDTITCFACTHSGRTLITGSQDMSLKVWETSTAKLTQVLVGHEGAISCVATGALDETLVVSGAQDCNLIVWDMSTGSEMYTLTGHNANILGVTLTPDASRALSYSEDNTLQLWDIKQTGVRLSLLNVHHNIAQVYSSLTVTYLAVWLGSTSHILPIVKHHNNSSQNITVELPVVSTPVTSVPEEKCSPWLRGLMPSLGSRTLKREQSFDSFYFEHMLHRGQSVDDFRKIGALAASTGSPFGSREQLWTGTHDDSKSSTTSSTKSRMISKLMNIGPKQKMLKKQQSMFACFPEFTTGKAGLSSASSTGSSGASVQTTQDSTGLSQQVNGAIAKKLLPSTKKIFPLTGTPNTPSSARTTLTTKAASIDKDESDESDRVLSSEINQLGQLVNMTKDSSICCVQ